MSLAREYKRKVMTMQRESGAAVGDERFHVPEGKLKAINRMAFEMDLRKLKAFNTIQQKADYKRNLLEKYAEAVQKYLNDGTGDPMIFVHWVIWKFDTGAHGDGLKYADMVIERGLSMPQRFSRDMQTFVADTVLEAILASKGDTDTFNTVFNRIREGTWQVHEAIQSKYYKYLADQAFDASDWQAAYDYYTQADAVYDGAKVKTRLEQARKKLEKTDA